MTSGSRCSTVIVLIICMALALPAWGEQYYLYAPQPVAADQKVTLRDGILVQEIDIQKGDTLYGLSRKFSGHGMYYPQILLFNSIKNPNLIYTGSTLKVPVSQKEVPDSEQSDSRPASGSTHKSKTSGTKAKKSLHKSASQTATSKSAAASPAPAAKFELSATDLKTIGKEKNTVHSQKKKAAPLVKNKITREPVALPVVAPRQPAVQAVAPEAPTKGDSVTGQKLFEAAVKAYRQDDCRTALEFLDRYLADNAASPLSADANLYKAECYLKLSAQ